MKRNNRWTNKLKKDFPSVSIKDFLTGMLFSINNRSVVDRVLDEVLGNGNQQLINDLFAYWRFEQNPNDISQIANNKNLSDEFIATVVMKILKHYSLDHFTSIVTYLFERIEQITDVSILKQLAKSVWMTPAIFKNKIVPITIKKQAFKNAVIALGQKKINPEAFYHNILITANKINLLNENDIILIIENNPGIGNWYLRSRSMPMSKKIAHKILELQGESLGRLVPEVRKDLPRIIIHKMFESYVEMEGLVRRPQAANFFADSKFVTVQQLAYLWNALKGKYSVELMVPILRNKNCNETLAIDVITCYGEKNELTSAVAKLAERHIPKKKLNAIAKGLKATYLMSK